MSVSKIKAGLPKGDYLNGLDAIAQALADDPHRRRVIIAVVDCGRVQLDHAEDADPEMPPGLTATARIRRVEAVAPADEDTARQLLVRAYEHRMGKVALDLKTDAELRALGINPETGEKGGE